MGGNELRFPRVGKREVKFGATPPNLLRNCRSKKNKSGAGGFNKCVGVVGVWGRDVGARVFVRGRSRVALGLGCVRGSPRGVAGGGCAQACAPSVGARVCPVAGACVCVRAHVYLRVCVPARCVRNGLYFCISLKIVLMKRKMSQGDYKQ